MEKKCPVCGGRFVGREDKIYCCDSCRANYHNSLYKKARREVSQINSVLVKNRKLLQKAVSGERTSVYLKHLVAEGFNPAFWTSSHKRPFLPTIYFCYEFSYCIIPTGIVRIKKINIAKYGNFRYL